MPSIVQAEKAVATKAKNKDGKKPFTERMTVSISPRAKRPHTETTGGDHRDPGSPDRYFEGADVHRPLIQATPETTAYLLGILDSPISATSNVVGVIEVCTEPCR